MESSREVLNKELHPHAEQVANDYADDFAASLLLQAKILAFRERADLVLSNHVEEARQIILQDRHKRWSRELLIVLGSALFGAFIPAFLTELSAGRGTVIAIYTVIGFLGITLVLPDSDGSPTTCLQLHARINYLPNLKA